MFNVEKAPETMEVLAIEVIEAGFEANKENLLFKLENVGRRNYEGYSERISENQLVYNGVAGAKDINIAITLDLGELNDGRASMLMTKEILDRWGVGIKDVFKECRENLKNEVWKLRSLSEVLGIDLPEDEEELMYVMSNAENLNGSRFMLDIDELKRIADKLERSYYILPSSIHECIILPYEEEKDEEDLETIKNMVYEINRTEVEEKDMLSDTVLKYNKDLAILTVA